MSEIAAAVIQARLEVLKELRRYRATHRKAEHSVGYFCGGIDELQRLLDAQAEVERLG